MTVARLSRGLLGTALVGALAAPALIAAGGPQLALASSARVIAPAQRVVDAPAVQFPVISTKAVDTASSGKRAGTVITAPCGSVVRAATAGTASVSSSPTSGPHLVKIITSPGKLVTWYGYMATAKVANGQIVAAGQPIGTVGRQGSAKVCSLYFVVTSANAAVKYNPTRWLTSYVGAPVPQTSLFGNDGFVLANFNTLGAVHTPSARYPGYENRTPKQVVMLNSYKVDVVGLQEFEARQRTLFLSTAKDTFGIWPAVTVKDSANSLIWRKSTFDFVSGSTIGVPYFQGRIHQMPVVLLRQKSTGRTAYFINVHNPASIPQYGDQSRWRAKAIAIERAKIVELRQTGRPVFLTGDLNDRANAFCPMTAGMLTLAANSVPSMTCTPPRKIWIDWVFAAGPARFTSYVRDTTPQTQHISDHPIILTRAHLSE
ncbi:MAG: peptidoglycan DD-metalloendopeptidase family protein [Marmoricola sp.]